MDKGTRASPTARLHNILGPASRSEQRTNDFLPRVLSKTDMLVIFLATVLFLPNPSMIEAAQGAGIAAYIYWIVGAAIFILPGMLVIGQLHRFIPAEGGIYIWSQHALGSLWGFFAGFCAWFPGILVLLATTNAMITFIQAMWRLAFGTMPGWCSAPWQQGLLIIAFLLLINFLAEQSLQSILRVAKYIVLLYGLAILLIGSAGVVWLAQGHTLQTPLSTIQTGLGTHNLTMYSIVVLAFLGAEVPMNMAAEVKQQNGMRLFLRWGLLLVLLVYAVSTFGIISIIPSTLSRPFDAPLVAVQQVYGLPATLIVGSISLIFLLVVALFYNLTFARILFVAGLDHRLPTRLTRVNQRAAPFMAMRTQSVLAILLIILTYLIGPMISTYTGEGRDFPLKVFIVSAATVNIIWCISMVLLFLDLPILLYRSREIIAKQRSLLIAPAWLLYGCSLLGGIASIAGILITFSASWDNDSITNKSWILILASTVTCSLIIGLIGSAYPRIMSSLEEQTAVARENARLYSELQTTYERLHELDQLKDAFLTTASHELRTPLTIMQGYLDLLGEINDLTPEMRQNFLTKARRACDELILLQANLMDASRVNFDAASLEQATIQIKPLCVGVIELFEPLILREKREIILQLHPEITVCADETRLKQVLRNLFSNALRYSNPNTSIQIKAIHDPRQPLVWISVIDQGLGIPQEKQELIFERFVRLERDMHGNKRGSGLGLAITRQLVEAMHGSIQVESSGIEGEGSTFSFSLPDGLVYGQD